MKRQLESFLEELERVSTLDEMQACTEALRDIYEIDHIVYHWVSSAGEQYGCGTYSDTWRDHYIAQDYLRVDPVIIGCYQRFHPVDWKRLDWTSKGARAFLKDALEHGVGTQGFTIPIRGPNGQFALFTLNHTCDDARWAEFTEAHRRDLILIAVSSRASYRHPLWRPFQTCRWPQRPAAPGSLAPPCPRPHSRHHKARVG